MRVKPALTVERTVSAIVRTFGPAIGISAVHTASLRPADAQVKPRVRPVG
jgi:hypothetical protein